MKEFSVFRFFLVSIIPPILSYLIAGQGPHNIVVLSIWWAYLYFFPTPNFISKFIYKGYLNEKTVSHRRK